MCGGERRHSSSPFPAGVPLLRKTGVMLCESLFWCLFAQESCKPQQARNSICSLDRHVNISPLIEKAVRFRSTTNPLFITIVCIHETHDDVHSGNASIVLFYDELMDPLGIFYSQWCHNFNIKLKIN